MCGGEYRGARQGTEKSGNQAQYLPEKAKKLPRILIFGGPQSSNGTVPSRFPKNRGFPRGSPPAKKVLATPDNNIRQTVC